MERVYSYGYPQAPPQLHTGTGLKWVWISFVLYMVALAINVVAGVVALSILSGGVLTNLGLLLPVLMATIVAAILLLVTVIFYFIGFSSLYKGRNEYGPGHARDVRRAFLLILLAIVVGVVGGVVQMIASFAAYQWDFMMGTVRFNPDAFYLAAIVGIAFGIAGAAIVAALLVLSVRNLAKPSHGRWLYVAAALGTATPGVGGALTLLQIPRILQLFSDPTAATFGIDAAMGLPGIVTGALGIVTFLLFLIAYRGAKERIDTGQLAAVIPPPQPTAWFPGPVAPPWTPPPQAPPPPP